MNRSHNQFDSVLPVERIKGWKAAEKDAISYLMVFLKIINFNARIDLILMVKNQLNATEKLCPSSLTLLTVLTVFYFLLTAVIVLFYWFQIEFINSYYSLKVIGDKHSIFMIKAIIVTCHNQIIFRFFNSKKQRAVALISMLASCASSKYVLNNL